MNLVVLVGNLGEAPEVKESKGVTYARFSLATTHRFKDAEGTPAQRTDWHRVVAFNGLAQTCGQLGKGAKVAVEGQLRTNSYQPEEGERRTVTEVHATRIEFLVRGQERE